MPVTTYSELKTEIQNWLGDDDVADFTDSFIATCEANLRRNFRVDELLVRDTNLSIAADTRELTLSSTLSSSYADMKYVRFRRPTGEEAIFFPPLIQSTFEELTEQAHETAWRPQYFHISNDVMEFERPTDQIYSADFFYYKKFTALSDSNTSNEILANYPDVYLWGSLTTAAPFIDNDERVQLWASFYNSALADIRKANSKKNATGPQRIKSVAGGVKRRRY